jgi:hypothetical protein
VSVNYGVDLSYLRAKSELVLLGQFYDAWLAFQQLASAKAERDQLEVAAQEIVDAHHKVQDWRATRQ